MLIHSAEITGSVQFNNTDVSGITNVSGFATTASVDALVVKTGSYASTSSVNEIQSKTGSYTSTSSFGAYTSSNDSTNTTQNARIAANEAKTGSYATTGSNTFIGTNVFTGSVYITSDLIVQGSSSLQNITASAVSIGTNTVILNTNTPILQFGGISVQDSGSTAGRSGSLLWNSVNDHWINVNPSGSDEGYNSAMVINGPKNTGSLGAEVGLTTNYVPVSQGEDHITDSIIFQSGSTNIGIGTTSLVTDTLLPIQINAVATTGQAYFASNNNGGYGLLMGYDNANGYARIRNVSNTALTFETNNTEKVRITPTGNVGIGTTSPGNRLAILGADETTNPTLGTNAGKFGIFNGVGAGTYGMIMGVINNGNSYIQVQRIDSTATAYNLLLQPSGGNVGIGIATANPSTLLHILYPSNIGKDTVQGVIRLTGQANTENIGTIPSAGTAIEFFNSWNGGGSTSEYSVARISGRASQGYDGGLQFDVGTNTGPGQSGYTTAMNILANGKVGIGTTSPAESLDVNGSIKASSGVYGNFLEGEFGQVLASVSYGGTTISKNLAELDPGAYLIHAYMMRGGDGVNTTYSVLWYYMHLSGFGGGSDYITALYSNPGPQNNNGRIALTGGYTVEITWGGARGPAAVTALKLRDGY
jgi:hypothetical protein